MVQNRLSRQDERGLLWTSEAVQTCNAGHVQERVWGIHNNWIGLACGRTRPGIGLRKRAKCVVHMNRVRVERLSERRHVQLVGIGYKNILPKKSCSSRSSKRKGFCCCFFRGASAGWVSLRTLIPAQARDPAA